MGRTQRLDLRVQRIKAALHQAAAIAILHRAESGTMPPEEALHNLTHENRLLQAKVAHLLERVAEARGVELQTVLNEEDDDGMVS